MVICFQPKLNSCPDGVEMPNLHQFHDIITIFSLFTANYGAKTILQKWGLSVLQNCNRLP